MYRNPTSGKEIGRDLPCPFLKIEWKCPKFGENALVRFYGLNVHLCSHLKCSFKSILEKKLRVFACWIFLSFVADQMFIEVPFSKKPLLPWKIPSCTPDIYIYIYIYKGHNLLVKVSSEVMKLQILSSNQKLEVALAFYKRQSTEVVEEDTSQDFDWCHLISHHKMLLET